VLPELSVRDNIAVFLKLPACRGSKVEASDLAERYELSGCLGTRAGQLSGGERRRLELLRALLPAPDVLLLDEPFAGLDPRRIQAFGRLLQGALEGSSTVLLLADHRLSETLSVVDEACLLLDGRLELRCKAEEFLDHSSVRGRYLPE
jgi:lipopolysaccharide export system ATP-binding protein